MSQGHALTGPFSVLGYSLVRYSRIGMAKLIELIRSGFKTMAITLKFYKLSMYNVHIYYNYYFYLSKKY